MSNSEAGERPTSGSAGKRVAGLFGLKGESWMRHANPASVWTRFTVLPLLAVALWSRDWIGWFCLIPVALVLVWMFINPLFFSEPRSTKNWASKGVLGERIWVEGKEGLPEQFRSASPAVAQAYQVLGLVLLVYGLVALEALEVIAGVLIVQGGKCWYLDRMVLLFDEMKQRRREYAAWEF